MKRLMHLLAVAAALAGTATLIGVVTDWRHPLERHPYDNPETIKFVMEQQRKQARDAEAAAPAPTP